MTDDVLRKRDNSANVAGRQVRSILADIITRFDGWRGDLAIIATRVARPTSYSADERAAMLATCKRISAEISEAHAEIIAGLADAPPAVSGHSRVVDIEKALDGIETTIDDLRDKLAG